MDVHGDVTIILISQSEQFRNQFDGLRAVIDVGQQIGYTIHDDDVRTIRLDGHTQHLISLLGSHGTYVEHEELGVGEGAAHHLRDALHHDLLGRLKALLSVVPHHLQRLLTDTLESQHARIILAGGRSRHQHRRDEGLTRLGHTGKDRQVLPRETRPPKKLHRVLLRLDLRLRCDPEPVKINHLLCNLDFTCSEVEIPLYFLKCFFIHNAD